MAEKSTNVYILKQASLIITERPHLEDLSDKRQKHVISVISQFGKIPYIASIIEELHLEGVEDIIDRFPLSSIQDCLDLYEREDTERTPQEPVKEAVSIPPELEALVAEYEEYLAEKNVNDGKVSSVAESVKRAREAMIIRERLAVIRRNRAALSDNPEKFNADEDKRYEELLVKIVNPKAKDHDTVLAPATEVIAQAVDSYITTYKTDHPELTEEQKQHLHEIAPSIVATTRYLALTEAFDISNHHDLVTAISVSVYKADNQFTTSISDIYAELDANAAKHDQLNKEIAQHQLQLSKLRTESPKAGSKEELDHYVAQISTLEATIAQKANQRDTISIDLTPFTARVEDYLAATTDTVVASVKKPDGTRNLDFDTQTAAARKLIDDIHTKLSDSGIQPRVPPPEDPLRQATDLEKSIRTELPQLGLNLHATNEGQQAAILISDPKTQSKDLSGQSVLLFSKGLTTKELDVVIAHAAAHRDDPNSALGRLYKANPDLFGTIRQQLDTIEKTDTPEAHIERVKTFVHDSDNVNTSLNVLSRNKAAFDQYLDLTKKFNGKEIIDYAKKHPDSAIGKFYKSNTKIFGKINAEFEKVKKSSLAREISKPIGRITRTVNTVKTRVSTGVSRISGFFTRHQSTINVILNPIGALRSYLGRRAAQFILRRILPKITNRVLRKGAVMLLKNGIKQTVKNLAKIAAKRIAAEAAKLAAKIGIKAGIQIAAQAANVIPGLGIAIAIAVEILWAVAEVTIGLIKKGLNWLSQNLYGEEFNMKTVARDTALAAGAAFGAAATAFVTFVVVASSIAAAAVASALGIIAAAGIITYFVYITSFLAAPIISTLAQLEATASPFGGNGGHTGDCIFPVHGGYPICQGPKGTYTHSRVEASDFCSTSSSEIHAIGRGTVSFAGNTGDVYGNYIIISTTTSAGTFNVWYAHLSEIGVGVGDNVEQDDVIGISGGTGFGRADYWSDHLHLEYRGLLYNSCPAGGIQLPEGCYDYVSCGSHNSD